MEILNELPEKHSYDHHKNILEYTFYNVTYNIYTYGVLTVLDILFLYLKKALKNIKSFSECSSILIYKKYLI